MHRFFIPAELFITKEVTLPADISRQISRVLRLKTSDAILLLDDRGNEYPSLLQTVNDTACMAIVKSKQPSEGEPAIHLRLILGLTQREKFELILQKCTEVGVSEFLPVITSRTLIQKTRDAEDKYPRWQKILREAAEQSHRGCIPRLLPINNYAQALEQNEDSLKLILWEEESSISLKGKLSGYQGKQLTLLVGPEGGLSAGEVDLARQNGFIPVSMGRRILRMETAAILAVGLALYELG